VSVWSALFVVLLVGAMTYAMRSVVIVALAGRTIPVPVERALRQVGPAVLMALAVNLAAGGEGGPSLDGAEALALLAAGALAWWQRNLLAALAAGMATLWIVTAIVG
jgi:branched-subunit amino acid transport protein